ncbi:alpha/beta hydrolase [Candidatus Finniella inopinata]|nr:alpha/beta hydrolase [Candidatus Finniella inopinata]
MIQSEFYVPSSLQKGGYIHVRCVIPENASPTTPSVICLHGAVMHNIIFDVCVDEGQPTFLEYLAQKGFAAFAISYRGYGESSKPEEMDASPFPLRPIMRYDDARQDVLDVLKYLQTRKGTESFHICGLSWGSVVAGSLATKHPDLVDKLVLLGAVYSYPNPSWAAILNPENPNQLNPGMGSYRVVTKNMITAAWDAEIPGSDKSTWRNSPAVELIVNDMFAGDKIWAEQQSTSPCFRIPTGVSLDVLEIYNQRPLYDASLVKCSTLILRGAYDTSSHPLDMENLLRHLGTSNKKMITFGNATHYAIAERKAKTLWEEISAFFLKD